MNPGPRILEFIRARGIPVVLGADAHKPQRVADGYETALRLLADLGFREINFFLDRKRQTVAIPDALASLRAVAAA
jgi:histidinol-phosphatase (PHP family)